MECCCGKVYVILITIYLANLIHERDGQLSADAVPINIGYLASYLQANASAETDVQLFSLPKKLEQAFAARQPEILAVSNYVWNAHLNYTYAAHYKSLHPGLVTVMGGPNYPGNREAQQDFLARHPMIDFYIVMEGEIAFLSLVEGLIEIGFDLNAKAKMSSIAGCQFLDRGEFVDGGKSRRITPLADVPSPYLNGMLDEFLAEGFTPTLQSNRGCPFSCAYCHSGNRSNNQLFQFPLQRVKQEIDYIGRKAKSNILNIADDNFGIFSRDREIAEEMHRAKKAHGWPLWICVSTSKINKDRVADCIAPISDSLWFSAAMQSMHPPTLQAVGRKNISFAEIQKMMARLSIGRISSLTELIVPLPEETVESHFKSIEIAIEAGMDMVCSYTTMLLHNTPLVEEESFRRYEMIRKWRVIPRNFGEYLGRKIVETEEVCVATSTISIEDYYYIRGFHFIVHVFYNLKAMKELIQFLSALDVSIFKWLLNVQERLLVDKSRAGELFKQFRMETKTELWDSEEDIVDYYNNQGNYAKLLSGEAGANLLMKYWAFSIDNFSDFMGVASAVAIDTIGNEHLAFINDLARFCIATRGDIFSRDKLVIEEHFSYDIIAWQEHGDKKNINQCRRETAIIFSQTDEQQKVIRDSLAMFGNNQDARGKILARIGPENLYRGQACIQCNH